MTITEPIVPIPPPEGQEDNYNPSGSWIFWYLIPNRSGNVADWNVYLHPLHSFDTSEDFLRLLNSIEHPSKLMKGCRYYVFRSFSKPLWEDETVSNGHRVSVEIEKEQVQPNDAASKWIDLVEDILEDTSAINLSILGVEFYSKPFSWKLCIWVSRSVENLEEIRTKMETITGVTPARISEIIPNTE